jgi:hypothetical protein
MRTQYADLEVFCDQTTSAVYFSMLKLCVIKQEVLLKFVETVIQSTGTA